MQERINAAFAYIVRSPFRHANPTVIKRLRGNKQHYRYRIGPLRFIYRVDRDNKLIRILQIDNRGDIYYPFFQALAKENREKYGRPSPEMVQTLGCP